MGVVYAVPWPSLRSLFGNNTRKFKATLSRRRINLETFTAIAQVFPEEVRTRCKIKFAPMAESSWKKNGRRWPRARQVRRLGRLQSALASLSTVEARNDENLVREVTRSVGPIGRLSPTSTAKQSSLRCPLMWVVLLATGIITIGFSFFFGTPNSSAQALMIASLSATIALVLFLIWALNHPFAGLVCVEPAAFQQLWNIIDQWAQQ